MPHVSAIAEPAEELALDASPLPSWGHAAERREAECLEDELRRILRGQAWFMAALAAVRDCDPPDWYVGGGVIRSLVWDHLHGYTVPTPLADLDVAFYDPCALTPARDYAVEEALQDHLPTVPWQARNQAAVHLWYGAKFGRSVPPLRSTAEAIATWPETATCVAVHLTREDELLVLAPYGLEDLFAMVLRHNPRRASREDFHRRLREKQIARKWPGVTILDA